MATGDVCFYAPSGIPADVVSFWRERICRQDPVVALTRSPEWYAMMAGDAADQAFVAVWRRPDGACAGVLPLIVRPWRLSFSFAGREWGGAVLPAAKVCGGDLLGDLTPADMALGWTAIGERYPGVTALWFDHVDGSERLAALRESAGRGGTFFPHLLFRAAPHYRYRLDAASGGRVLPRSRKSLNRLRTKERALARELGQPLQLAELRQPPDWQPYEQRIEALMNRTWQARHLGHTLRMADQIAVAARGWMRSFVLTAGDRVVAFVLCYQGMGTLFYEQLGYDETLGKFSPGTILLHRVLEYLPDRDPPAFVDFGEGEADYKQFFANDTIQVSSLLLVRRTMRWRRLFAVGGGVRRMDRLTRLMIEKVHLKQWLWRRFKHNV